MRSLIILFTLLLGACGPSSDDVGSNAIASPKYIAITGVPSDLFKDAMDYFHANQVNFKNQNYVTIVDFALHSSKGRMFIVDMKSGQIEVQHVAHGVGSDPKNTGYATKFSNVVNSYQSSLGFYRTAETFNITKSGRMTKSGGVHLIIDGLSPTNSKARERAIQVHGAKYVYSNDQKPGMSEGCFAVPWAVRDRIIGQLKGGSLLYAGISQGSR